MCPGLAGSKVQNLFLIGTHAQIHAYMHNVHLYLLIEIYLNTKINTDSTALMQS